MTICPHCVALALLGLSQASFLGALVMRAYHSLRRPRRR